MIKYTELRIGNKVWSSVTGQTIQTVRSIDEQGGKDKPIQPGYERLIRVEENGNQYKPIELLPIPIDVVTLLANKFEEYGDVNTKAYRRNFMIGGMELCWYTMEPILKFQTVGGGFAVNLVSIRYLHQLQNLWYLFESEEL